MALVKNQEVSGAIEGLHWTPRVRLRNGGDSYVVPFPDARPFNLVFHGHRQFSYGHYGVHLGQRDQLTFLGPSTQKIHAYFIDCRGNSATFGSRVGLTFNPTSQWTLVIPPGVAHAFDSLENVFTINSYDTFLPEPAAWADATEPWSPFDDVLNLPLDIENLPRLLPNPHRAAEPLYRLVADYQMANVRKVRHEFPTIDDVKFADGTERRVALRKPTSFRNSDIAQEPIAAIMGCYWNPHPIVWSGPDSGFSLSPMLMPYYIVDHGEQEYSHDAFGIHVGQEDHLTFVGNPDRTIRVALVDCRENSPTLGNESSFDFIPSAQRELVIPNGVAHRFEGLGSVYTINRPRVLLPDSGDYQPGNDVIDWPISKRPLPLIRENRIPASDSFYRHQSVAQRLELDRAPDASTPIVLVAKSEAGSEVRVALRKRID